MFRLLSRPTGIVQLILPPSLLSYFAWALRRCNGAIGIEYLHTTLGRPWLSAAYRATVWTLIPSITVIFLRLYFLPSRQSIPPQDPTPDIERLETIFECVPPPRALRRGYALIPHDGETGDLVQRCSKCSDNWKPARARHCSDCGVCRAGFDHHCAFFANCLTARYMPAFVALITITPVTVFLLSLPLYWPLALKTREAWLASTTIPAAVEWWAWKPSWIIPCGPMGRWVVGLSISWLALDRATPGGGGAQRLELGALVGIGGVLALVTLALAYTTLTQIRLGDLNIDFQRSRAYTRALSDAAGLQRRGQEPTPAVQAALDRFEPRHWFFVPIEHEVYAGVVLPTQRGVYDAGPAENFDLIVKRGRWDWFLPWNAVRSGMKGEVWNWPVSPSTRDWLVTEAERVLESPAL